MAKRIVDVLEIVQIDVEERQFVPTTARILDVATGLGSLNSVRLAKAVSGS